ncbi:uncharacterized protein I206_105163 [Kwoniella pini CBS 10737]|uniref:Methyltransferase type 11 domain-containing protein n=1 Tax=Kwoniella pini CBS 10737 TaxID=1296096 RepID=A0A1B9I4Z8_9TREE|nr:uncharacterized protein I206_03927 [Kwoniella pini CBS 10737]OCF50602.1 hypothetical protein I206_03927 [Kwoniella pini CBS 10737]
MTQPEAGPSTITSNSPIPPSSKSKKTKEKPIKTPEPRPEPKQKPKPVPVGPFERPDEEEEKNVHEVYEAIAGHFSQTRHKPWPFIQKFLHSLPPNSIGLDSGAGNGKYLPSSREANLEMIALDRSSGLLEIARNENGGECVRGDLGFRGWRDGVFDFAISIAAIHHLSTPERRRQAVKSLMRPLKLSTKSTYSKFMIYVWAYEQGTLSKRRMGTLTNASAAESTSIPKETHPATSVESSLNQDITTDKEDENEVKEIEEKIQDLLVPWVYSKPPPPKADIGSDSNQNNGSIESEIKEKEEPKVYHRYYHLFVKGELREMVIQSAKEDNYQIIPDGIESEILENHLNDLRQNQQGEKENDKWIRVRGVGWEADNWWIECEVGKL